MLKDVQKISKHTIRQWSLHTNYTQSHACGRACSHKRNALSGIVSWQRGDTQGTTQLSQTFPILASPSLPNTERSLEPLHRAPIRPPSILSQVTIVSSSCNLQLS